MALRLRIRSTTLAALGMAAMIVMVGALFPAVGGSIGKLSLPAGVTELLGGADYGTLVGWMRSEIAAIYGPLVVAAVAISGVVGSTAGEEERGIAGLVLAHPVPRRAFLLSKAAAAAIAVAVVAVGTWIGLAVGVAIAGGGIGPGQLAALAVHIAFFGFATGSLALALAAITGRADLAAAGAGSFALVGFLVNGFAPLIGGLGWLKYLFPFHYYAAGDPLARGLDLGDLASLGAGSAALTGLAVLAFSRRDLRR
jgi:ABC-2 type transport system permease protein